jgi:hypothetical protein
MLATGSGKQTLQTASEISLSQAHACMLADLANQMGGLREWLGPNDAAV